MQTLAYILNRGITHESLTKANDLMRHCGDFFTVKMRDVSGVQTGKKIRYVVPRDVKEINSKGSKMGYLYLTKLNLSTHTDPLYVVEGSIDRLTMLNYTDHVVGIPSIVCLQKFIKELRFINTNCPIIIFTDTDVPSSNAVKALSERRDINLNNVFDARSYLGKHKDMNDFVTA